MHLQNATGGAQLPLIFVNTRPPMFFGSTIGQALLILACIQAWSAPVPRQFLAELVCKRQANAGRLTQHGGLATKRHLKTPTYAGGFGEARQRTQNALRGGDHGDAERQLPGLLGEVLAAVQESGEHRGGSLKRKGPEGFMRNARKQEGIAR